MSADERNMLTGLVIAIIVLAVWCAGLTLLVVR